MQDRSHAYNRTNEEPMSWKWILRTGAPSSAAIARCAEEHGSERFQSDPGPGVESAPANGSILSLWEAPYARSRWSESARVGGMALKDRELDGWRSAPGRKAVKKIDGAVDKANCRQRAARFRSRHPSPPRVVSCSHQRERAFALTPPAIRRPVSQPFLQAFALFQVAPSERS